MDFSFILFIALVVTGIIWLWDKTLGAPRRARLAGVTPAGNDVMVDAADEQTSKHTPREPMLVEYAKAFFPVILLVFVLRSFIVEPFRIPSGSMLPSLRLGDFILVNKFSYGIRLPVINKKILDIGNPERGDVMVFRFPRNESVNFIKRVIGIPGDEIRYDGRQMFINQEPVQISSVGDYPFEEKGKRGSSAEQFTEIIGDSTHSILEEADGRRENHVIHVPEGHYFMMGDNRDNSNDSRYWGFVAEENIVGRAFFIWFSWDIVNGGGVLWKRIGLSLD